MTEDPNSETQQLNPPFYPTIITSLNVRVKIGLPCTSSTTISQLKEALRKQRRELASIENLTLLFKDKELDDSSNLGDYGINKNDNLLYLGYNDKISESPSKNNLNKSVNNIRKLTMKSVGDLLINITSNKPTINNDNKSYKIPEKHVEKKQLKTISNRMKSPLDNFYTKNINEKCKILFEWFICYLILIICIGIIFCSIDIAVIIINKTYNNINCKNEGYFIQIIKFSYIASILGFIVMSINVFCVLFVILSKDEMYQHSWNKYKPKFAGRIFIVIGNISWIIKIFWSIIGIISWNNSSNICKNSSLGKVTLSWCIINIVFSVLVFSCCIVLRFTKGATTN